MITFHPFLNKKSYQNHIELMHMTSQNNGGKCESLQLTLTNADNRLVYRSDTRVSLATTRACKIYVVRAVCPIVCLQTAMHKVFWFGKENGTRWILGIKRHVIFLKFFLKFLKNLFRYHVLADKTYQFDIIFTGFLQRASILRTEYIPSKDDCGPRITSKVFSLSYICVFRNWTEERRVLILVSS